MNSPPNNPNDPEMNGLEMNEMNGLELNEIEIDGLEDPEPIETDGLENSEPAGQENSEPIETDGLEDPEPAGLENSEPIETDGLEQKSIQMLSQGTFGCAYFPYINCDGTPDDTYEYLSKIQTESTYMREKYIGEKIKEIPNYSYFFAPVVDGCELHLDKFKEMVDTTSCAVIHKKKKDSKKPGPINMYTSKIKFIPGESLHSYMKRRHVEFVPEDTVFHFQQLHRIYHVCRYAIEQLKEKQIVHYDVKLENIMYHMVQRAPILIDFGLSFYIPDLTENADQLNKYLYTPKFYHFWPIESFLASNMVWEETALEHEEAVNTFMAELSETLADSLNTHPNKKQIETQREQFHQAHLSQSNTIEEYLQTVHSWDFYGLAVSFVRILPYLYHYEPAVEWANQLFMYIYSKDRAVL